MMSSDSCIVGGPWASDFTLKAHSVRQCGGGATSLARCLSLVSNRLGRVDSRHAGRVSSK